MNKLKAVCTTFGRYMAIHEARLSVTSRSLTGRFCLMTCYFCSKRILDSLATFENVGWSLAARMIGSASDTTLGPLQEDGSLKKLPRLYPLLGC